MQTLKNRYRCRLLPNKRKFLLIFKANAKNWEFFLIFLFSRPTNPSNFEKNPCSRKLNWSGLNEFRLFLQDHSAVRRAHGPPTSTRCAAHDHGLVRSNFGDEPYMCMIPLRNIVRKYFQPPHKGELASS